MVETVRNAISLALHREFPQAHIYVEDVSQGMVPGDFLLRLISWSLSPVPGDMRCCRLEFSLTRFGDEALLIGSVPGLQAALDCLLLPSGIRLRALKPKAEIKEGKLQKTFGYSFYSTGQEREKMEQIKLEKNGEVGEDAAGK